MQEIAFYRLTVSPVEKALPALLQKAYEQDKRVLVLANTEAEMESLNSALWTFRQDAFLPHGSRKDPQPERQPVYLTNGSENPNSASILVAVNGREIDGLKGFERGVDMFDSRQEGADAAFESRKEKYQSLGLSPVIWEQNDKGGWGKSGG